MKKFTLLGVTLGLAAVALLTDQRPRAPSPRAASPPTSTVSPDLRRATPPATVPTPASRLPETRAFASALHQVLPSVTSPVANWRDFDPAHLTVTIAPNAPIDFERVTTKHAGARGQYTVWTGRNPDLPGAGLIGIGYDGGWSGTLSLPGAHEYQITVEGDRVSILPKLAVVCTAIVAMAQDGQSVLAGPSNPVARPDAASPSIVDVVFFYNDEVVQRYGSSSVQQSVEVEAVSQIERANQVLQQSQVDNLEWRFVAAEKVPSYATPSGIEDDLRLIATNDNAVGQFVQSRMNALGADQAVLYIAQRRANSGNTVGIANTPGHHSVVLIQADSLTTAHEMAHNFGCMHDRTTDSVPDSDTHYYFGHRFVYRNRDCGTVMSYASNLLPYFSNPDVSIDSSTIVFGTSDRIPSGIPAGQPKAADNARWLREHAAAMAATRAAADAPRITSQPASTTLRVGDTLTLSVTATGNHLAYQWSEDGSEIAGATASSYTKTNVQSADAGAYTVLVSNLGGSVRSSTATVTIAAATQTPSPSSGSSGSSSGGGGGGALSDWALAALVVLGAIRLWQQQRRNRTGNVSP